ncbi:hypothetical protein [Flexivirga alba]|uniref:RNA polymerase sigma-70 region 2 domain-containing protein n=1 Tax=Flexivirga alba TaxID=702742 RepID=A0ABW2AJT7_9MICO
MIDREAYMSETPRRKRHPEINLLTASAAPALQDEMLSGLLLACSGGDLAALARLYDATSVQVFGLIRRMRPERAPELMIATYLQTWRRCANYDPAQSTASVWILSVVLHQIADCP